MSKNVRLRMTENEKIAQNILGANEYSRFNMQEDNIDEMIAAEKTRKFNDEVDYQQELLNKEQKAIEEAQENIQANFDKIEIKPLFNRLMVKPFAANPFQRMVVHNGIITDTGGLNPQTQFNSMTGEYEERDQNIVVATVIETGPECKYIKTGDTVFYFKQLPTPVPFFKQGFWTIKEDNIIAVVNEGLTERFNNV